MNNKVFLCVVFLLVHCSYIIIAHVVLTQSHLQNYNWRNLTTNIICNLTLVLYNNNHALAAIQLTLCFLKGFSFS